MPARSRAQAPGDRDRSGVRQPCRAAASLRLKARVVVVESAGAEPPRDKLDDEFRVVARLSLPVRPEQLGATLACYRPRLILCKHPLERVEAWFVAACRAHDVEILVLADPAYGLLNPASIRRFGGLPWLRLRRLAGWSRDNLVKRGVDLVLATACAPLLLPLMLIILLAVSCSGPPLFFQVRVGAGGRPFRMVKFRTMRVGAERATGPVLAQSEDIRVTRVGRVLRRLRLDELPQLWNVFCGHMSLVGPRPERPEFVADLRRLPHYDLRHLLRPGITGIAQLTGGYAATAEEKLRCDLLYLHCRSLRFDLMLLAVTVAELVRGFPRG